jgi:hypothetical protein
MTDERQDLWEVRLTEDRDAYEILAPGREVVDTVPLVEASRENFHDVMRRRIETARRVHRVKRFAELLKETE